MGYSSSSSQPSASSSINIIIKRQTLRQVVSNKPQHWDWNQGIENKLCCSLDPTDQPTDDGDTDDVDDKDEMMIDDGGIDDCYHYNDDDSDDD